MSLAKVDEPRELKRMIKELNKVLGDDRGKGVLLYNKLPQYLWSAWSNELKKLGIDWREFLSIISRHSDLIADWAVGEKLTWEELLSKLNESIQTHSKAKAGRGVSLDAFVKKT
ncbi:MAG: hypothetical protein QW116_02215 [Zestosphaera sp.]